MTRRTKQNSPREDAYEPFDEGDDGLESDEDASPGDPHALHVDARIRHAPLAEDDGVLDPDDDNLSDLFASLGVEERLDELGM